jgi:hypothetical protein
MACDSPSNCEAIPLNGEAFITRQVGSQAKPPRSLFSAWFMRRVIKFSTMMLNTIEAEVEIEHGLRTHSL